MSQHFVVNIFAFLSIVIGYIVCDGNIYSIIPGDFIEILYLYNAYIANFVALVEKKENKFAKNEF